MGADLYIPAIHNPLQEKWRPIFDAACKARNVAPDGPEKDAAQARVDKAYEGMHSAGYFRDSYNPTSILHRLDLSWWRDLEYDPEPANPDESREINVSPALCEKFLAKVLAADFQPLTAAELRAERLDASDPDALKQWNEYFTNKRERLIEFLRQAIANGGMYASC